MTDFWPDSWVRDQVWDPEFGFSGYRSMTQTALEDQFEALGGPDRGTGRPKAYHLADGKRVPSVTTITARFKESTGLINWANRVGMDGQTTDEARKGATDVGSIVHRMVEARIHGEVAAKIPAEFRERAQSAFGAWEQWMENNRFQIVATEQPIVSEKHRYGGTLDCVAKDARGALCLLDWKSSNAIYSDYLLQLAAYAELWHETHEERLAGGFHICRFAKEHGDFEHRWFPQLDEALEMFLLLRRAYDLDKDVKRRAK